MSLEIKVGYNEKDEIKKLFSEYTDMLIENEPGMAKYLKLQDYDYELSHLENKYGMPEGRLYIAYVDGSPAGCVCIRKLSNTNCELKRLFVRPKFRGHKLGEILVQKVIDDAKSIGYKNMYLDTLPFLESAIHLYTKLGFYKTDSYVNSTLDTSIYMKLEL